MGGQKVYCEVDFLKKFIDLRPTAIVPSEENVNSHKTWINLYEFIFKSELLFDSTVDFHKMVKENDFFKLLWKKSTSNASILDFLNDEYPNIEDFSKKSSDENNYLTSVFLTTSENEKSEEIQNNFGVIVLSVDQIFNTNKYFTLGIEAISSGKTSHTNWDFITKNKHICNSMCIVDNYLFAHEENIDKNLIPILDKLLPKTLKIPFHISIFTLRSIRPTDPLLDFISLAREISKKIKIIRPNGLDVVIGIFSSNSRDFHDRAIISNNMVIESGSGFDLFRTDRYSDDDISIHQTKIISYYHLFVTNLDFFRGEKTNNIIEFLLSALTDRYQKEKKKFEKKGRTMYCKNRLLESFSK